MCVSHQVNFMINLSQIKNITIQKTDFLIQLAVLRPDGGKPQIRREGVVFILVNECAIKSTCRKNRFVVETLSYKQNPRLATVEAVRFHHASIARDFQTVQDSDNESQVPWRGFPARRYVWPLGGSAQGGNLTSQLRSTPSTHSLLPLPPPYIWPSHHSSQEVVLTSGWSGPPAEETSLGNPSRVGPPGICFVLFFNVIIVILLFCSLSFIVTLFYHMYITGHLREIGQQRRDTK